MTKENREKEFMSALGLKRVNTPDWWLVRWNSESRYSLRRSMCPSLRGKQSPYPPATERLMYNLCDHVHGYRIKATKEVFVATEPFRNVDGGIHQITLAVEQAKLRDMYVTLGISWWFPPHSFMLVWSREPSVRELFSSMSLPYFEEPCLYTHYKEEGVFNESRVHTLHLPEYLNNDGRIK